MCQVSIFRVHLCIDLCIMLMFESVYIHLYIYKNISVNTIVYVLFTRVCLCMYVYDGVFD